MAFLDEIGLSYFWKGILAKMKSDCAPASHVEDK